jgi:hypothetical protein
MTDIEMIGAIFWRRFARSARVACLSLVLGLAGGTSQTAALEEEPGEMDALKACEKQICTMILDKKPVGDDFKCRLSKTWAQSTIKGGETKTVRWGFGDARCSVSLKLSRADVVDALTKPEHTIELPLHAVKCEIVRENEVKSVSALLAPKLQFKDGKAKKVWINLDKIDGPADIKATVWTAANLEDSLGIFHKGMIKSINKFMHKQCAERYGDKATTAQKKPRKEKKDADASQTKATAAAP